MGVISVWAEEVAISHRRVTSYNWETIKVASTNDFELPLRVILVIGNLLRAAISKNTTRITYVATETQLAKESRD